jgi:acetoacetate decarboxylase
MKKKDVLSRAFGMPLTSPAFPIGPDRASPSSSSF